MSFNGKILCRVKGCHRGIFVITAQRRWGTSAIWFICATHWQRLSKREKAVMARINRQKRKFGIDHFGRREHRIVSALIRRAGS